MNPVKLRLSLLTYTGMALIICMTFLRCENNPSEEAGNALAGKYCGACHQVPDPDILPRHGWEEILPQMAAKMGIYITPAALEHRQLLDANGLSPESPVLTAAEWLQIRNYYLEMSPDTMDLRPTPIAGEAISWLRPVPLLVGESVPAASLAAFSNDYIYYGDAVNRTLYEFNPADSIAREFPLDGAPSGITDSHGELQVLTMGNIHPNDLYKGKLYQITQDSVSVLIDSLARPVHVASADLNGNGLEDYVISGFGYLKGDLSWYEQLTDGSFRKHLLRALPGAIRTEITDLNGDGHLDILALMAQGDEGFFLYEGNGRGKFSERRLLSFHPSYGSSYFELADMNGDDRPDIVYTNGDNGDYAKPILKPYHGVHVFLQEDDLRFSKAAFVPVNGPFKAMVEDYNLDGYPDIACISYFPDYENTPEEGFLMLLNQGPDTLSFQARTHPAALYGKWLTADRADYDNDGDIDILLGNGPIMSLYVPDSLKLLWKKKPVTLLLLKNTRH